MSDKMRKYVNIIAVAMQIVTLITFFVSFIVIDRDGIYGLLWLWPLTFFAYGLFVFGPFSVIKPEHLLGISLISILEFFPRYVLYPLAVSFAGNDYRGIEYASLTSTEIQNAIIMAVFELVIVGVFLFFYERGKKNKNEVYKGDLKLSGSPVVYAVFVAIAAAAYIFVGRQNNVIRFFANADSAEEAQTGAFITLVKYIVSLGLLILSLLLIYVLKKHYNINRSRIYAYLAILVAMLHTSFLVGTSRSTQVAVGVLMIIILIRCFPSMKVEIVVSITVVTVLAVSAITFIRTGRTSPFKTGDITEITSKLQIYFGGPQSLAQSVNAIQGAGKDGIGQMLFDFVRSCFPFNLVFKNMGYTTNQWYNLTIYDGRYPNGQLLFSSSFGYIFMGVFGIGLDTVLNVFLLLKSSEFFGRARSFEGKYLAGYCLIRFTFTIMENTPSVLGSVTQYIGTLGLLIVVSKWLTGSLSKSKDGTVYDIGENIIERRSI